MLEAYLPKVIVEMSTNSSICGYMMIFWDLRPKSILQATRELLFYQLTCVSIIRRWPDCYVQFLLIASTKL